MFSGKYFQFFILLVVIAVSSFTLAAQSEDHNYVLKTKGGFLLVLNRPTVSFSIEFKGEKFEPRKSDHPVFVIDDKPIQVVTALREQFWKTNAQTEPTDEELLDSHKTWESDYLGDSLQTKLSVTSEFFEIPPKRKVMFWSFPMPKEAELSVSHYLLLTTVIGKDVLALNSSTKTADDQSSCRAYLVESMNTLKTSDKPFNIKELTESLAKDSPAK